jgi:hypothetical protein
MVNDRDALIHLLTYLEESPRPEGWRARIRRFIAIRDARRMLQWDELRDDGPAGLIPVRNHIVSGLVLLWAGCSASALIFSAHAVTIMRVIRVAGITAVPLAVGIWYYFRLMKRVWTRNEREYALYVEKARALPAPADSRDAGAAV